MVLLRGVPRLGSYTCVSVFEPCVDVAQHGSTVPFRRDVAQRNVGAQDENRQLSNYGIWVAPMDHEKPLVAISKRAQQCEYPAF